MKLYFIGSFFSFALLSCSQPTSKQDVTSQVSQDTTVIPKQESTAVGVYNNEDGAAEPWLDALVGEYMRHSNSEMIQLQVANNDTSFPEVWIDQGKSIRNGVTYYMCQVGHHMAEEDGSEPRFVTDGWAYVDSAKRILYEYDLGNDSLIIWKK